jgi:hypothetical protein
VLAQHRLYRTAIRPWDFSSGDKHATGKHPHFADAGRVMTELKAIFACGLIAAALIIGIAVGIDNSRDISIPSSPASITDCWPDWKPTQ